MNEWESAPSSYLPPVRQHYRYASGCLEKLIETAFDLPGSACGFDLQEIHQLLD
jgi:hypothetical protein